MTFEEFFIKKRIDLAQLQRAKPDLYEEFRDHYSQMSEKSFDHTKKYWFNRLRKDFLLKVAEVPKSPGKGEATASAGDPVPDNIADAMPAGAGSKTSQPKLKLRLETDGVKGVIDNRLVTPKRDEVVGKEATQPATKPTGFKPRFRSGSTTSGKKTAELQVPEKASELKLDKQPVKPASEKKPLGFKPRFKAAAPPETTDSDSENELNTEAPNSATEPKGEASPKPLGFKSRFKAGKTNRKD